MLWTLLKVILFLAVVTGLAFGAGYLGETEGGVRIAMMGYEVSLGPLQTAIALLVLVVALWALLKLIGLALAVLRFLSGERTALSAYFDRTREKRGFVALGDAMLALASGEGRVALARATKAEKLLHRPELTNLLTAEAALMAGDTARAKDAYKHLLEDERSRFVALRGLTRLKLDEGDTKTALALAQKALALKPGHAETQDLLLKLQAGEHDWKGARQTLATKLKSGEMPRDLWKRRDAVLALQEARVLLDDDSTIEAREAAIAANAASPDLIPAAALAARSYIAQDKGKNAAKLLRKTWSHQPHPDLAAAFAEIAPDETPQERVKRFKMLVDGNPDHEETHLVMAELQIAAEDFPAARKALGDLVTRHPTARVLTIMAAVERGEGADDAVVRGWLARALTAPRGPQWVCTACHAIHAAWQPVCENCEGFDTLAWTEAPQTTGPSATQTEMLPLLVGQPAPEKDETPVEDASTIEGSADPMRAG